MSLNLAKLEAILIRFWFIFIHVHNVCYACSTRNIFIHINQLKERLDLWAQKASRWWQKNSMRWFHHHVTKNLKTCTICFALFRLNTYIHHLCGTTTYYDFSDVYYLYFHWHLFGYFLSGRFFTTHLLLDCNIIIRF